MGVERCNPAATRDHVAGRVPFRLKTALPMTAHRRASSVARIRRHPISHWSQFVDTIQSWPGFRTWAFRGQGDAAWPLQSTLSRHIIVSKVGEKSWPRQESRIRRIFERKSHLYLEDPPSYDELEWMAVMQHHGAPTRLLDFTWSPYVAAFFALERATASAAIWAINLPLLWEIHDDGKIDGVRVGEADPRDRDSYLKYFLPNRHAFVWQGDPFRMPQRVIAQSGTFLVAGHVGLTVEEIIARYPKSDDLLIQFVFDTAKLRADAMAVLYSMNITQATLFPGLDGLARSMAYEFEYSWEVDLATDQPRESLIRTAMPEEILGPRPSDGARTLQPPRAIAAPREASVPVSKVGAKKSKS